MTNKKQTEDKDSKDVEAMIKTLRNRNREPNRFMQVIMGVPLTVFLIGLPIAMVLLVIAVIKFSLLYLGII